jgi:eukaryotic-like serine/threonine-protein kinase
LVAAAWRTAERSAIFCSVHPAIHPGSPSLPDPSVLERLTSELHDRYRVEEPLGEGGMAIVFAATDVKHNRRVAVKVLRPELSAVVGAERFLQEIQVTARLQHPHILPLYDSGSAGGLL